MYLTCKSVVERNSKCVETCLQATNHLGRRSFFTTTGITELRWIWTFQFKDFCHTSLAQLALKTGAYFYLSRYDSLEAISVKAVGVQCRPQIPLMKQFNCPSLCYNINTMLANLHSPAWNQSSIHFNTDEAQWGAVRKAAAPAFNMSNVRCAEQRTWMMRNWDNERDGFIKEESMYWVQSGSFSSIIVGSELSLLSLLFWRRGQY